MDKLSQPSACRVARISSVAPSRAAAFQACALSEAFRAGGVAPRLPTHPKGHFGTIAHDFIHSASVGTFVGCNELEVRLRLRAAIDQYEKGLALSPFEAVLIPLSLSCEDFEFNLRKLTKAAFGISSRFQTAQGFLPRAVINREKEASSKDGLIVGRLDKVKTFDNQTVISDLKTGQIRDGQGSILPHILLQLRLYAYLLHESTNRWPDRLVVSGFDAEWIEIPFTPEDAANAAADLKELLTKSNLIIDEIVAGSKQEAELASPSPEACKFCVYRLSCAAYWNERSKFPDLYWPRDVRGTIKDIKTLGKGLATLELLDSSGRPVVIRGILETHAKGVDSTGKVTICGLKSERAPGAFSWRPTSVLLADK